MTWTAPKTDWTNGELVSADDMNAIGENFAALAVPLAIASYTTTSDITATPREWTDIDGDNLNFTLTTAGGDVMAHFQGAIHSGTTRGHTVSFNLEVDGVLQRGGAGIVSAGLDNNKQRVPIGFTNLIQNLSAGIHTFKFQWVSYQNREVRLKADAQFWLREI